MVLKTIGYKILHFPLTKILIGIIIISIFYGVSQYFLDEVLKTIGSTWKYNYIIIGVISSILTIISYIFLYKVYEKRKIKEFSKKGIIKNLILGIALGTILQSLTILVIYLQGGYSVLAINSILFVIPSLVMAFTSAIFEEILFRAIIFRILEEKLGSYIALIFSAFIFGLLHLSNPNGSLLNAVGLAIQAGLLLAVTYMYSRSLWLPIAVHFAWNFTQTAIFGAIISGNSLSKTFITSKIEGKEWLTGGEFGPEGSIQATVFCLIATIIFLILTLRKGNIIKPYWKKTTIKTP